MHGKTTTSSMAAHVLRSCGFKPSHYVGAEIPILGTNARWDSEGEYFVAEGDESDGTLINYHPEHAIVLNIEPDTSILQGPRRDRRGLHEAHLTDARPRDLLRGRRRCRARVRRASARRELRASRHGVLPPGKSPHREFPVALHRAA